MNTRNRLSNRNNRTTVSRNNNRTGRGRRPGRQSGRHARNGNPLITRTVNFTFNLSTLSFMIFNNRTFSHCRTTRIIQRTTVRRTRLFTRINVTKNRLILGNRHPPSGRKRKRRHRPNRLKDRRGRHPPGRGRNNGRLRGFINPSIWGTFRLISIIIRRHRRSTATTIFGMSRVRTLRINMNLCPRIFLSELNRITPRRVMNVFGNQFRTPSRRHRRNRNRGLPQGQNGPPTNGPEVLLLRRRVRHRTSRRQKNRIRNFIRRQTRTNLPRPPAVLTTMTRRATRKVK